MRRISAFSALLALLLVLLCPGCDRDIVRNDINQGAYELFQTGLNTVVSHLSSQIVSAAQGATTGSGDQP